MTIEEIKHKLDSLQRTYASKTADGIYDKIRICFVRTALNELSTLLRHLPRLEDETLTLISHLKNFLRSLIDLMTISDTPGEFQPNLLFYTSSPKSEFTALIMDIASWIYEKQNSLYIKKIRSEEESSNLAEISFAKEMLNKIEKSPIEIFLPGINIISYQKGCEACQFVKIPENSFESIRTDDELVSAELRNNSDSFRSYYISYIKTNLSIFIYNNQLYVAKQIREEDYLEIKTIVPEDKNKKIYEKIKQRLNSLNILPQATEREWTEVNMLHQKIIDERKLSQNNPSLIESGGSYFVYGRLKNIWALRPVTHAIHKKFCLNAFKNNSDKTVITREFAENVFNFISRDFHHPYDYTTSASPEELTLINSILNLSVYESLNELPIETVMNTPMILSGNRKSLIPVRLLADLTLDLDQRLPFNPYSGDRITREELNRLALYSLCAKKLIDSRETYFNYVKDLSGFGRRVLQLCDDMLEESVRAKGSEEYAGEDFYLKIHDFQNYYNLLSKEDKSKISIEVREEIENKIFEIASNKKFLGAVASCLVVRRRMLLYAMKLEKYERSKNTLKESEKDFYQARAEFIKNYGANNDNKKSYFGGYVPIEENEGSLKTTSALLKSLGCGAILEVKDVYSFFSSSSLSIAKIKNLIKPLSNEERGVFLKDIATTLIKLIFSIEDFTYVIGSISSKEVQQSIFDATILPKLEVHIHSIRDYKEASPYITQERKNELLNYLNHQLPHVHMDIIYDEFIQKIKESILETIKATLKQQWIDFQSEAIRSVLEKEQNSFKTWIKENVLSPEEMDQIFIERLEKQKRFFEEHYTNKIQSFFSEKIDIFSPGKAMIALFESHPWIQKDPTSILVSDFISMTMVKHLLNEIKNHLQFPSNFLSMFSISWEWLTRENYHLLDAQLLWETFTPEEKSLYYPHEILDLYLNPNLSYPHFESMQFPDFKLTRIDLYRILAKNKTNKKTAVLDIEALRLLSLEQINYFEKIFVNIKTEYAPEWFVLQRNSQQWIMHLSQAMILPEKIPIPSLEVYYHNLDSVLNDLQETISPLQQWHSIVLHISGIYPQEVYVSLLFKASMIDSVLSLENQQAVVDFANENLHSFKDITKIDEEYKNPKQIHRIFRYFSDRSLQLFDENQSIMLSGNINRIMMVDAFNIVYYHNIKMMILSGICSDFSRELNKFFDCDINLRLIESTENNQIFQYASFCAARNRFLEQFNPSVFECPRDSLWQETGKIIVNYYHQHTENNDNITQMGVLGLDSLFAYIHHAYVEQWDIQYKEPSPSLTCKFDLQGNVHVNNPAAYIQALTEHLEKYDTDNKHCSPLFKSLSFILPNVITENFQEAMLDFVRAYYKFKEKHADDSDVICLYNANKLSEYFFDQLIEEAKNELNVLIYIPEWDIENIEIKFKYREAQNKILHNQRIKNSKTLEKSIENIYKTDLLPEIIVTKKLNQDSKDWIGDDEQWVMQAEVNTEYQQEHEQDQQQQQQQQLQYQRVSSENTEEESDPLQVIEFYDDDEKYLIDRKHNPGLDNFEERFSTWVGSYENAAEIIEKIDPQALDKILLNEAQLTQDIEEDNLPAGFYLKRSRITFGLILCFCHRKEIDDIKKYSNKAKYPFKRILRQPLSTAVLQGDARQFDDFKNEAVQKGLPALYHDDQPNNSDSSMGQLFNYYGRAGLEHLEFIDKKVSEIIGIENAKIWRLSFLETSRNWAEVFDRAELDALALSLVTLIKDQDETTVWWRIFQAHGKVTGFMRYADIWFSYQATLKYIEDHRLTFNVAVISRYLENAVKIKKFNAQVFLHRLYSVLKRTLGQIDSSRIAQSILNNIDKINWQHNGFYYAICYNHYLYWDADLKLENLYSTVNDRSGYDVPWSVDEDIIDYSTHVLRFVSKRAQMPLKEFEIFKSYLKKNPDTDTVSLRIYCGCISIGVDRATTPFSSLGTLNPEIVNWINQAIDLSGTHILQPKQLQIRFNDIARFSDFLEKFPLLRQRVLLLKGEEAKIFLNACGRVLQSKLINFESILKFLENEDPLTHPLLLNYPWLVNDYNPYLILIINEKLKKKLDSIDFTQSTWFPEQADLHSASWQSDFMLRNTIAKWIDNGCYITDQDAPFRSLNQAEIKDALAYCDRNLSITYKYQVLPLCERFFSECLAIEDPPGNKNQYQDLLKLLVLLDNKDCYSELKQILALLLANANTSPKRFYSATLLTFFLDFLCDKTNYDKKHYPFLLLKELLLSKNKHVISLLNGNLHSLKRNIDDVIFVEKLNQIIKSELPLSAQRVLLQLMLSGCTGFIDEAKNILEKLHSNPNIKTDYITLVHNLVIIFSARYFYIKYTTEVARRVIAELELLIDSKQPKLIDLYVNGKLFSTHLKLICPKYAFIANCFQDSVKASQLEIVINCLSTWSDEELEKLARYLACYPCPSIGELELLLTDPRVFEKDTRAYLPLNSDNLTWHDAKTKNRIPPLPESARFESKNYNNKSADDLIHYFESVIQAWDYKTGESKRNYSLSEKDYESLTRVLNGIKFKGKGYITAHEQDYLFTMLQYGNAFAEMAQLSTLHMNVLVEKLHQARQEIKTATSDIEKHHASVRLLSCMREVLLRKTGLWVNHTQMLDLMFSSFHDEHNMLHQLHTGEGKSIITAMRTAYLALNGNIVDLFSAKESLSSRDHAYFSSVFTAMDIRHAYITEQSEAHEYHACLQEGVGAVNYATAGNFDLFYSRHVWKGQSKIPIDPSIRVSYLDEVDYLLLDEETQFNFSDSEQSFSEYNLEAWVYQSTYEYYIKNKDTFIKNEDGTLSISKNIHLKGLYEYILKDAINAPRGSTFLKDYIIPANEGDENSILKRNNQLKYLLFACHKALKLEKGKHYCIQPELRTIGSPPFQTQLQTQTAKVMIANQVIEGATYSDLVHQFLHTRLNNEFPEGDQFFIDPVSQIVLTQNIPCMLNQMYGKKEGCSRTLGNQEQLEYYEEQYGFEQFIKIPTHLESLTEFLPTEYCDNEQLQVDAIIAKIRENTDKGPILITCEDDEEVERYYELIINQYKNKPIFAYTNETGRTEKEILKFAGHIGSIIITAKMGRGTHIDAETKHGLTLIRTQPADPRTVKQENGRPGRYGEHGRCVGIFDYSKIEKDYKQYQSNSSENERLNMILDAQIDHLEEKLENYEKQKRDYSEYDNEEQVKKCLITRSVVQLRGEIKNKKKIFHKQYAALRSNLNWHAIEFLSKNHPDFPKSLWISTLKEIESEWIAAQPVLAHEEYLNYIDKVRLIWKKTCTSNDGSSLFDPEIIDKILFELKENKMFFQLKKNLINALDGYVQNKINHLRLADDVSASELKVLWSASLEEINAVWVDMKVNTPEQYQDFIHEVKLIMQKTSEKSEYLEQKESEGIILAIEKKRVESQIICEPQGTKKESHKAYHGFTSWWISNIRKYGDDLQGLETFNKVLTSVNQLPNEEGKRKLYEVLLRVMESSLAHKANLSSLSVVVELLRDKFEHPNYDMYLKCLEYFFQQCWINEASTSELSALLILNMRIMTTVELEEKDEMRYINVEVNALEGNKVRKFTMVDREFNPALEEVDTLCFFSNNLCSFLYSKFKNNYDDEFYSKISIIFARYSEVTQIFVSNKNQEKLERYLELIFQATQHQLDQLSDYFLKEFDKLSRYPSVVQHLFEIVLAGIENENAVLPNVNFLGEISDELYDAVWYFLSQRTPIDREDVNQMVPLLQRVVKVSPQSLRNIPPYLPLFYGYQYDLRELINSAGKALNAFLLKRRLITLSESFIHPPKDTLDIFKDFISVFCAMDPERNIFLFKLLNEKQFEDVPSDLMLKIASWYVLEETSDSVKLRNWCILAANIQMLDIPAKDYLNSICIDSSYENMKFFVDTLLARKQDFSILSKTIRVLWEKWSVKPESINLNDALETIKIAQRLKQDESWLHYFEDFSKNQAARQAIMMYFIGEIMDLDDASFKDNCYQHYHALLISVDLTDKKIFSQVLQEIKVIGHYILSNVETMTDLRFKVEDSVLKRLKKHCHYNHLTLSGSYPSRELTRRETQARQLYNLVSTGSFLLNSTLNSIIRLQHTILIENGGCHSQLNDTLQQLVFDIIYLSLKNKDHDFIIKLALYVVLENQLAMYREILPDSTNLVPNEKQHLLSVKRLLTNLLFAKERPRLFTSNRVNQFPAIHVEALGEMEAKVSASEANEYQQAAMRQLAENIQRLPGETRQYFTGVFNQTDINILSNDKSLLHFFITTLLCREPKINMQAITIDALWTTYQMPNNNKIDLNVLFDVVQIAMWLNDHLNNNFVWMKYFDNFDKNQGDRQNIMQCLLGGWLNLGDPFKNKCHSSYAAMVAKIKCSSSIVDRFVPIMKLLKETELITKNAGVAVATEARTFDFFDTKVKRNKVYYRESIWMKFSVDKKRKALADSIFEKLTDESTKTCTKIIYYKDLLETVLLQQTAILAADKKDERALKFRSSRLYSIMQELFFDLTKSCLLDPEISYLDKKTIYDTLNKYVKLHIETFILRLPDSHSFLSLLKALRTRMANVNVWEYEFIEIKNIQTYLQTQHNNIPNSLVYLLEPIHLLCEMTANKPVEQSSMNLLF